jgi:Helix-turn-helix domain
MTTDIEPTHPATPPAAADAQQLDTAIRQLAKQAHIVIEALAILVEQAKATNIHQTLGYPSWTAYIADALDGQWKLERDKRGKVIQLLASQGMSQRAIAATIGAAKTTVHRELSAAGGPFGPPEITGLDGKNYLRPQPSEPSELRTKLESEFPWLSVPVPAILLDFEWQQRSKAELETVETIPEVWRWLRNAQNQLAEIHLAEEHWRGQILNLCATIAPGCDANIVLRRIDYEAEALSQACVERIAVLEGSQR